MIAVGSQKTRLPSFAAWRLCARKKKETRGEREYQVSRLYEVPSTCLPPGRQCTKIRERNTKYFQNHDCGRQSKDEIAFLCGFASLRERKNPPRRTRNSTGQAPASAAADRFPHFCGTGLGRFSKARISARYLNPFWLPAAFRCQAAW